MKRQYKFIGRSGRKYVWQSTTRLPGDSRVEEIRCDADWFWNSSLAPYRVQEESL